MFIKEINGGYVNSAHVEWFVATAGGKVNAYTTVITDDEQECYIVAECGTKEAAQKWLDKLIEKLNAGK